MNKNYIGTGLIAIAIVLFWAFALPLYDAISDLDAAIKDRNSLLSSRNTIITNINNLNKEYQKRTAEITKLSAIVPAQKSIAEVLSAVDNITSKNGIQLISSTIAGQNISGTDTGSYNILSIDLSSVGSYPGLTNALRAFESNLRLIDITSLDAASGSGNNTSLNFNIKGRAYYLK